MVLGINFRRLRTASIALLILALLSLHLSASPQAQGSSTVTVDDAVQGSDLNQFNYVGSG